MATRWTATTGRQWNGEAVTIRVGYERFPGRGECAESCQGELYDPLDGKAVNARIDDCIKCCTCVEV